MESLPVLPLMRAYDISVHAFCLLQDLAAWRPCVESGARSLVWEDATFSHQIRQLIPHIVPLSRQMLTELPKQHMLSIIPSTCRMSCIKVLALVGKTY